MTINYTQARENMVEQQVRPWDVLDARVLETLATLPREAFVAETHRALAYADLELPLGHGQSMMKPVVEGRTLQALRPQAVSPWAVSAVAPTLASPIIPLASPIAPMATPITPLASPIAPMMQSIAQPFVC